MVIQKSPTPKQFKYTRMSSQPQKWQQLQTIQKYLSTLFDSLPHLPQPSPSLSSSFLDLPSQIDAYIGQVLEQNIQYGKKIIQLSDKFTAKYRRDHFVDRRDVQEKIKVIYQYFCPNVSASTVDQMVGVMVKKIADGGLERSNSRANSVNCYQHFAAKDSKVEFYKDEADPNFFVYQSSQPLRSHQFNRQTDKNMARSKYTVQNIPHQPSETDLQAPLRKRSTNKSKMSKKSIASKQEQNFTTKAALQIKTYFQQEQSQIRKLFLKFNKILDQANFNSNSVKNSLKISQQNREFTKCKNQGESFESVAVFVHANVQNMIYNLGKIFHFVDLLEEFYEKKGKIQGLVQGKFETYIEQIDRRQSVFSFGVSKMLQTISLLKQQLSEEPQSHPYTFSMHNNFLSNPQPSTSSSPLKPVSCPQLLKSLEQIASNFYTLYPSHTILKDLKIQGYNGNGNQNGGQDGRVSKGSRMSHGMGMLCIEDLEKIGYCSFGVQVGGPNGKTKEKQAREGEAKRNLLELFKTHARVNEMIEKFQRSTKFKKTIDLKQIQKLIQSVRDSFPKKTNNQFLSIPQSIASQAQSYHQQLKRLIQQNERSQKQLLDQCNKKSKKYQKQIQQLQKVIQQLSQAYRKQQQKSQLSLKKLAKKLESQKQQYKKLSHSKISQQKSIKQLQVELSRLQAQMKQQYNNYESVQQNLLRQNKSLIGQIQKLAKQIADLKVSTSVEKKKFQEEIEIYHSKIIILQSENQTHLEQEAQTQHQLSEMISQNKLLSSQIEQLTSIYEQKIKQLSQVIDNVHELDNKVQTYKLQSAQKTQSLTALTESLHSLQSKLSESQSLCLSLQQKYTQKQNQLQKYKQLSVLNQDDIAALKQEMDKVKDSYLESEEQLEEMRMCLGRERGERDRLEREIRGFRKEMGEMEEKGGRQRGEREKIERENRELRDQVAVKRRELSIALQDGEDAKRELVRLKKQLFQARENSTKCQSELRMIRQQLHKKTETESLESGKRKLELQATKVQLRRKTEQLQKIKQTFQQKIQALESKNKQLTQFITQKQLLAKITQNHMST